MTLIRSSRPGASFLACCQGGLLLDLADVVTGHSVSWWDQPNAVILGAGATIFVAYVIIVTEVLRDVRFRDKVY